MYQNELSISCIAHDVTYSYCYDLAKRIISDKILKDRAYEISTEPNNDGYQQRMVNLMYKPFEKKIETDPSVNEVLAQELHKQMIKKWKN